MSSAVKPSVAEHEKKVQATLAHSGNRMGEVGD